MSDNNSVIYNIRISPSLLKDPLWIDLDVKYKHVFFSILERVVLRSTRFDDHGVILRLDPGEVCITIRDILKILGPEFNKNQVQAGVKKLILYEFITQEIRHTKSVFTIIHPETLELIKSNAPIRQIRLIKYFKKTKKPKSKRRQKRSRNADLLCNPFLKHGVLYV